MFDDITCVDNISRPGMACMLSFSAARCSRGVAVWFLNGCPVFVSCWSWRFFGGTLRPLFSIHTHVKPLFETDTSVIAFVPYYDHIWRGTAYHFWDQFNRIRPKI